MATNTLYRREDTGYGSVPGYTQPGVTPGNTSSGGGNTTGNYVGNPVMYSEAPSQYFPPNRLVNAPLGQQQYNDDTGRYGMLASYFGPNARYASNAQTSNNPLSSFGSGGVNGLGGLGVRIDWDLPNKQAEFGTTAFFNKLYQDSTYVDPQTKAFTDSILSSINPTYISGRTNTTATGFQSGSNTGITYATDYPNQPKVNSYSPGTSYGEGSKAFLSSMAPKTTNTGISTSVSGINYSSSGYNRENIDPFGTGTYGFAAFNKNTYLAPSSMSGGKGISISGYNISGTTMNQYRNSMRF